MENNDLKKALESDFANYVVEETQKMQKKKKKRI